MPTLDQLLTGQRGEPFYLHVIPLDDAGLDVAVSVRELGTSMGAFRTRYRLSKREADVVELVLLGYRNKDIAATLGTSPTTIKKHLTHIFDKVGVDTRTQLIARIARMPTPDDLIPTIVVNLTSPHLERSADR